ncbi:MAG: 5-formyltetrahydrofolate cyclo-ligase [Xanthobacteraceae bacterium]|nr:5-formyltetrahydrofolate cyclo-ligase [Xanthobacteraceae bacterium]
MPVSKTKIELRTEAFARRDALSAGHRAAAAQAIARHAGCVEISASTIVAGFSAIRSEIDVSSLMQAFGARGASLALPVAVERNQPLIFRAWTKETRLVRGMYGIFEPSSDAEEVEPDIVLVPLAAFDRRGHRIGYGGGYYDRTLSHLRKSKKVVAIGVAFAVQEIDDAMRDAHDEPLDLVLTENEIIDLRSL